MPTKRQHQTLAFIRAYIAANGYPPTYDEIGQKLRVSRSTVAGHVAALEELGLLKRGGRRRSRTLELLDDPSLENRLAALEKRVSELDSRTIMHTKIGPVEL